MNVVSIARNTTPSAANAQDNLTATGVKTATGVASRYSPSLSEEDAVTQAFLLKALASPTRLRILNLLSRYEGVVSVFEIAENFPLEQPTISHHLRILRDAGLIDYEKKGLWAYYYVHRDALKQAQNIINNLV